MAYKSREEILALNDLELEELNVPEWQTSVFVRGLSGDERDIFEGKMIQMNGNSVKLKMEHLRALLVYFGTCNKDGSRKFRLTDIEALGKKSAAALERIAGRIQVLSKMRNADIKELTENFTIAQDDDSTTN
jgi:hypothetical protein